MNKYDALISLLPISTDRLIIKETNINDVDLIIKMDKQEETQKFLGGIKNKSKEERIKFLSNRKSLTICLKDGTSIGFLELKIDENNNYASISYIFDYEYTNMGYCSEAVNKIIDISFNKLNLNKIVANVVNGNITSIRVLEKNGFKRIGINNENFIDYEIINNRK